MVTERGLVVSACPGSATFGSYTLHPIPYTLNLAPCTTHSTPYTLNSTPYSLLPTSYSLLPTPLGAFTRHEFIVCSTMLLDSRLVSERGAARAQDAPGTPTQSHISPRILVSEIKHTVRRCRGAQMACSRCGRLNHKHQTLDTEP